jgi:hypothetical protein
MFDGHLTSQIRDSHDRRMAFGSTRGAYFHNLTMIGRDRISSFPIARIAPPIDLSREPTIRHFHNIFTKRDRACFFL